VGDRLFADTVVVVHLLFIAFALAGGALVLARPWLALVHVPAAAWAAYTEFSGTICPLTPLENTLRRRAGQAGYDGGFVEHYVIPVIYPPGLTPSVQAALGTIVVAVNVAFYVAAWRRARRVRSRPASDAPVRSSARPGR
jgi:hypothetical protein